MGRDIAGQRLASALAEQEHLTRSYEKAVGTSQEVGAYLRLRAASLRVATCQRLVDERDTGSDALAHSR